MKPITTNEIKNQPEEAPQKLGVVTTNKVTPKKFPQVEKYEAQKEKIRADVEKMLKAQGETKPEPKPKKLFLTAKNMGQIASNKRRIRIMEKRKLIDLMKKEEAKAEALTNEKKKPGRPKNKEK